jgi:hypothetical protein
MKKYICTDGERTSIIFVGEAEDIAALHKSICRASEKGNTSLFPIFVDMPRYNPANIYGLGIEENGSFSIIAEGVIARLFLHNALIEVKD